MTPFVADGDKQVMHSLATLINTGAKDHAIAQAPHHFELWRLAEIDEDTGTCKGPPTFLADASSLVREGVRSERVQELLTAREQLHRARQALAVLAASPEPSVALLRVRRGQRLSRLRSHVRNLENYIAALSSE